MLASLKEFLRLESASSVLLLVAAVLALIIENSPLSPFYNSMLDTPVAIQVGEFAIAKPLLLWINDGLMALFFLVVGLELKREVLAGELKSMERIILPGFAAVGGMAFPALIYTYMNWGNDATMVGWAIPSATDIAFALGVLSVFGRQVPTSLKLFLLTLAIVDDIGAIIIIAFFYTNELNVAPLLFSFGILGILYAFNRRGVTSLSPYILLGMLLWVSVLKSGVHATLAGVVLALFIPYKGKTQYHSSPLKNLENDLHPAVAYIILPIFAFANAGVALSGISVDALTSGVTLGIALGLFLGNQIGVVGFTWLAIRLGISKLPKGITWLHIYGVALLCGIGFTMSLFIGSLAFGNAEQDYSLLVRLGIIIGSIVSAISGYLVLYVAFNRKKKTLSIPQSSSTLTT